MRDKRVLFALLAVLACGLIAAGCGSDDSSSGSDTTTTTEQDATGSGDSTGAEVTPEELDQALENIPQSVEEAVELCKQGVEASGISGDAKDQALQLCDAAGG